MNSWFKEIYESLSINILIEKSSKISNAGCALYDIFMTSAIFWIRPLILKAYLSCDPEYKIKHIL